RLAIEHEGRGRRAVPVGPQRERGAHLRRRGVEGDVELDSLDQPVGRAVVLKTYGAGLFRAHIRSAFPRTPTDPFAVTTVRELRGRRRDGDVFTHIPSIRFLL